MSYAQERQIIETLFQTEWVSGSPAEERTPVAYPDHTFDASAIEVPWVRLSILSGAGVQGSIGSPGSNLVRRTGVLAVQINVLPGSGSQPYRELADEIEPIFLNRSIENLRFAIPYPAGAPETVDGWTTWTMFCPYTRDEFNG